MRGININIMIQFKSIIPNTGNKIIEPCLRLSTAHG